MQQIFDFFSGAGREVALLIVSMTPLIELRGSIPLGAALGMEWPVVFLISVVGNLLPVPFIVLFGRPLFKWLKSTRLLSGITAKYEAKLMSKADKVTRYETIGLCLFVGIPLPGTGAWTGALVATFLEMPFKNSMLSISLGSLTANLIMSLVSYDILGAFL